jgi:AcrR family transcriptional regulator
MNRQPRTAGSATARPATRGPKPKLTREQIAEEALELVDRDGLDALTMQGLAERLGIGTMTLYGYFRSKDELLDALVDAAVSDEPRPAESGPWREQMRELAEFAHRRLERHPSLVALRLRGPVLRPEALRFGEAVLRILGEAGLEGPDAAQSFRLLFTYLLGYAALSPGGTTDEQRRQAAAAIALLPEDEYPNLKHNERAAAEAMAGEEAFAFGLERILDGIEALR